MIYTIFRARLKEEAIEEYEAMQAHLLEKVKTMPGFVSYDAYASLDGEQLAIEVFQDQQALSAWMAHPAHQEAQRLGKECFYSEYHVLVCEDPRTYSFPARKTGAPGQE